LKWTKVRLYVIPGSHPARAAELMLRHKGIDYKRTDLPPVLSRFAVHRVLRFPGDRVPAMKVDGRAGATYTPRRSRGRSRGGR
jgi:glutathione S-transferase